jgi:thiol-disulfide isomerase/thioredoxin
MPSLDGGIEWINSPPLSSSGLRGKVVLVDFWTFTCVNWLRTLPYIRKWYETYGSHGLVVIGVHTPEFGFEGVIDNVRHAVAEMDIHYPVVTDNNYAIWRAFENQYWPAEYLIDARGRIRYNHFGEEAYAQTEHAIEELLSEAGRPAGNGLVTVSPKGLEVAADWNDVASAENFLGYNRTSGFASPGGIAQDRPFRYEIPHILQRNEWALSGDWTAGGESVRLNSSEGRIAYRFHARDVNLVMGPSQHDRPIRFRALIDGRAPGTAHGSDTDADGRGVASRPQTYQLIRQQKPIVDRQFEIEFFESGAQAYDFTFG